MRVRPLLLVLPMLIIACDDSSKTAPSPAVVADKKAEEDAEMQKRIEERKQKRLAEEKAKEEAEAAKKAAIEKVAVLPEKLPKGVGKACDDVGTALDEFMNRLYADDSATLEKWNSAKGTQLPMTVATCVKAGSVKVAACQKAALDNAPPELKEDQTEIMRYCIDKFGRPGKGSAVPPK